MLVIVRIGLRLGPSLPSVCPSPRDMASDIAMEVGHGQSAASPDRALQYVDSTAGDSERHWAVERWPKFDADMVFPLREDSSWSETTNHSHARTQC